MYVNMHLILDILFIKEERQFLNGKDKILDKIVFIC